MRPEVESFFQLTRIYPNGKTGLKEAFQDGWDRGIAQSLGLQGFREEALATINALNKEAFQEGLRIAQSEARAKVSPSSLDFMILFSFMVDSGVSPEQAAKSAAWATGNCVKEPT